MKSDEQSSSAQPNGERILQVTNGFIASKFLFEASELKLFEKLGDRSLTLPEIAELISIPERSARILVDAITVLGFLEKKQGKYQNGSEALTFLSGNSPTDFNPYLILNNRVMYPKFANLGETLKKREQGFEWSISSEQQEVFSAGIEALNAGLADSLSKMYDFSKHRSVIDLGGGTGSFLIPICTRYSQVECALFELPNTAKVAKERIAKKSTESLPLASRIKIIEGDLLRDAIPSGYDALILANVVHIFSPEHVRELLTNIRKSIGSSANLLLVDFWTDADHVDPPIAALLAGAFLCASGEGDVYSLQEIKDWLKETGWTFRDHVKLAGPKQSLVVAEAQ